MRKRDYKTSVGSRWIVPVNKDHVADSEPCNKDHCMLSCALQALLTAIFGDGKFRVKSTNHGAIVDVNGRRLTFVFDTKTATRIYNYDRIFKRTHSKIQACASVKPFTSKIMIEANVPIPVHPPMSDETKKQLAKHKKDNPRKGGGGARFGGSQRELSM